MIYSFPLPIKPFNNDTVYWDNLLSSDQLNLLLAQPEWVQMNDGLIETKPGMTGQDTKLRKSKIAWLDYKPGLADIWQEITNLAFSLNQKYFQHDLTGFYEPMQLAYYASGDGGHYDWHSDIVHENKPCRKLSLSLLLDDPSEFDGGELQVMTTSNNPTTLESKKGRVWFFPSYVLHRVTPVTRGIRRSLVLWIGGPSFR